MKKFTSIICIFISILMLTTVTVLAATPDLENSNAVSTATINSNSNNKFTPSGVATVKLYAIGSGLVDADWSVVMSKGLLTTIDLNIYLLYGPLYQNSRKCEVLRFTNWTSEEYGSVQTSWDVGTKLKTDMTGTIEVNGMYDYPISSFDYGVTTVK